MFKKKKAKIKKQWEIDLENQEEEFLEKSHLEKENLTVECHVCSLSLMDAGLFCLSCSKYYCLQDFDNNHLEDEFVALSAEENLLLDPLVTEWREQDTKIRLQMEVTALEVERAHEFVRQSWALNLHPGAISLSIAPQAKTTSEPDATNPIAGATVKPVLGLLDCASTHPASLQDLHVVRGREKYERSLLREKKLRTKHAASDAIQRQHARTEAALRCRAQALLALQMKSAGGGRAEEAWTASLLANQLDKSSTDDLCGGHSSSSLRLGDSSGPVHRFRLLLGENQSHEGARALHNSVCAGWQMGESMSQLRYIFASQTGIEAASVNPSGPTTTLSVSPTAKKKFLTKSTVFSSTHESEKEEIGKLPAIGEILRGNTRHFLAQLFARLDPLLDTGLQRFGDKNVALDGGGVVEESFAPPLASVAGKINSSAGDNKNRDMQIPHTLLSLANGEGSLGETVVPLSPPYPPKAAVVRGQRESAVQCGLLSDSGPRTVLVACAQELEDLELAAFFEASGCGAVVDLDMRRRGEAIVEFGDAAGAAKALELSGRKLQGRSVFVNRYVRESQASSGVNVMSAGKKLKFCFLFRDKGWCRRGDDCKDAHHPRELVTHVREREQQRFDRHKNDIIARQNRYERDRERRRERRQDRRRREAERGADKQDKQEKAHERRAAGPDRLETTRERSATPPSSSASDRSGSVDAFGRQRGEKLGRKRMSKHPTKRNRSPERSRSPRYPHKPSPSDRGVTGVTVTSRAAEKQEKKEEKGGLSGLLKGVGSARTKPESSEAHGRAEERELRGSGSGTHTRPDSNGSCVGERDRHTEKNVSGGDAADRNGSDRNGSHGINKEPAKSRRRAEEGVHENVKLSRKSNIESQKRGDTHSAASLGRVLWPYFVYACCRPT
jgi:hypothetical protein